jgi:hypothetical protein
VTADQSTMTPRPCFVAAFHEIGSQIRLYDVHQLRKPRRGHAQRQPNARGVTSGMLKKCLGADDSKFALQHFPWRRGEGLYFLELFHGGLELEVNLLILVRLLAEHLLEGLALSRVEAPNIADDAILT